MCVHAFAYIFIFLQGFLSKYTCLSLTAFFNQDLYEEVINLYFFLNYLGLGQELKVKGRTAAGGYCDHTNKSGHRLEDRTRLSALSASWTTGAKGVGKQAPKCFQRNRHCCSRIATHTVNTKYTFSCIIFSLFPYRLYNRQ